MDTATLSESALDLFRRRTPGERVPVTNATRPAYRELVGAGIMVAGHSFTGRRESVFKFTEAGWGLATSTRPAESTAPRA